MAKARFLLPLFAAAASAACGSIADPGAGNHEPVATISGKLTTSSAVPANTHVSLVWRNGAELAVGADAAVVNREFTIPLDAPPPDAYFFAYDASSSTTVGVVGNAGGSSSSGGGTTAPPEPTPIDAGAAPGLLRILHPLSGASGSVGDPMDLAVAGFIVYIDGNGDGKLDLSASSPDQAIGGASDLLLAYLRNGAPLDYQRMADKQGAVPAAGYNLALTEGRWVSLDLVDLTFSTWPQLPGEVCSSVGYDAARSGGFSPGTVDTPPSGGTAGGSSSSGGAAGSGSSSGGATTGYPDPSDPNLKCSADGRSYSYGPPSTCPTPTPPPYAVCNQGFATLPCAVAPQEGGGLAPDAPVPPGWPCPVATPTPVDAGVPGDAKAD